MTLPKVTSVDQVSAMVMACEWLESAHGLAPGRLRFEVERIDAARVPETKTKVMLIVGDPSRAFAHAAIPNAGVGLARIEFIITSQIGIHPMAIAHYPALQDAQAVKAIARRIGDEPAPEFFIRRLSEGVARIAAAKAPEPEPITATWSPSPFCPVLVFDAGALGAAEKPASTTAATSFSGEARPSDSARARLLANETSARTPGSPSSARRTVSAQ